MTKNPFINALAAISYVVLVASVMIYATEYTKHTKSIAIPVTVLSLFTLSAAVMGYIFLSQPLQLYFDGKKKAGMKLFTQTVAVFAGAVATFLVLLLTGVFK